MVGGGGGCVYIYVCVFLYGGCVGVYKCVCLCVCVRERERGRVRESANVYVCESVLAYDYACTCKG